MSEPQFDVIVGTRPELIKMAPVVKALRKAGASVHCVHSGQHTDLAARAFEDMGFAPDLCLLTRRTDPSIGSLFSSLYNSLHHHFANKRPDAILVHGDTTTAWAAAMVSFYHNIPVAHIEAGLRCPNLQEPFPEEAQRRLIGRLATWHFAPTQRAASNLKQENASGHIVVCGNTAIDSIGELTHRWHDEQHIPNAALMSAWKQSQASEPGVFRLLVTLHRRENWGSPLSGFMDELAQWMRQSEKNHVIWPLHANPDLQTAITNTARSRMQAHELQRLHFIPALSYPDTIWALQQCNALATDSGGLQEEASAFFKPTLVLRNSTERPEALEAGYAHLTGCGQGRLCAAIGMIQSGLWPVRPAPGSEKRWPFGDGKAATRIANHLIEHYKKRHSGISA